MHALADEAEICSTCLNTLTKTSIKNQSTPPDKRLSTGGITGLEVYSSYGGEQTWIQCIALEHLAIRLDCSKVVLYQNAPLFQRFWQPMNLSRTFARYCALAIACSTLESLWSHNSIVWRCSEALKLDFPPSYRADFSNVQ